MTTVLDSLRLMFTALAYWQGSCSCEVCPSSRFAAVCRFVHSAWPADQISPKKPSARSDAKMENSLRYAASYTAHIVAPWLHLLPLPQSFQGINMVLYSSWNVLINSTWLWSSLRTLVRRSSDLVVTWKARWHHTAFVQDLNWQDN